MFPCRSVLLPLILLIFSFALSVDELSSTLNIFTSHFDFLGVYVMAKLYELVLMDIMYV